MFSMFGVPDVLTKTNTFRLPSSPLRGGGIFYTNTRIRRMFFGNFLILHQNANGTS